MQKMLPQNNLEKLKKLITQYDGRKELGASDTQDKLIEIADFISANKESLNEPLKDNLGIEVTRLLLQERRLSLAEMSRDVVLSKMPFNQLEINNLGSKVGDSIIDQIVLMPFVSLIDKITLFNYVASAYKKDLNSSLEHLLIMSHIADRGFYNYIEGLILRVDDIHYFPQKYSYNPYEGKQDILNRAVSHLLNIAIKREVKRPEGISYMRELIKKYSSIIKYRHIYESDSNLVSHPVFYLVEEKMWHQLREWIEKDQNILMMADSTGKNPLITTILTFAHGYVKGQEHDSLFELQKFSIDQYVASEMFKMFSQNHRIIEPQIGLFIGFLEYDKAKVSKTNEIFVKTTKSYYKSLVEYFINTDRNLKYNNFLKARINGTILPEFGTSEMVSFISLIIRSSEIPNSPFIMNKSQLDVLPKDELIIDLYKGLIIKDKISERADRILEEVTKLFTAYNNVPKDKNTILDAISEYLHKDKLKPLDQLTIGQENLISKMFNDYLKICYSDIFSYKAEISNKLYSTIIAAVSNENFNPLDFIINNPEVVEKICLMGCERLLDVFENRIKLEKKLDKLNDHNLELDDLTGTTKINPTKLLKTLVPSSITALWFGHKDNSNVKSYEEMLKITDILNTIIRRIGRYIGEQAILLNIEHNYVNEEHFCYMTCQLEQANIHTNSSLDLQFIDGKFQIVGHGLAVDYIRLYNFYSSLIVKKLYIDLNFDYEQLFQTGDFEEIKQTENNKIQSIFNKFLPINHEIKFIKDTFNKAKDVIKSIPYVGYNLKHKINTHNVNKAINFSILYLSNRNNQFLIEKIEDDKNLSELCDLFSLDLKNPIFKDLNYAASDLWDNIRMIGSQRTRLLLDFLIAKQYIENDQENIKYIITRCIKTAIISKDIDGVKMWLDYTLEKLSLERLTYPEIIKTNVLGVKNQPQVMAIHDALNISTILNIPDGIEAILSNYKNFLILYRYPNLFDKHTTMPFENVRRNSMSKMMEIDEFKEAVNRSAVVLLENGYPIELVEKCDHLKVESFIQSIIADQVKFSLKRLAINYSEILPIPFINQFKESVKSVLEVNYYLQIYEKSFNFLYGKTQENVIDIRGFCHIFSSVLQPPDFLKRLQNITFMTGLKTDYNVKNDGELLMKQAKNIALIAKDMDDEVVRNFTVRWNAFIMDQIMDFPQICQYVDENINQKINQKSDDLHEEKPEINFFEYLYRKSEKRDIEVVVYKLEQENSMKVLSQVGAALITGTFIYFNNPEVRNTLITVIPTVYSGLTLAGSISSNILTTVSSTAKSLISSIQDMSYTGLYLVLAGATIYASYKIYQEINHEKIVKLDLEMLEDLVEKYKSNQSRVIQPITSRINVYNEISKIFKTYTGTKLMQIETFFSVINKFGITSAELDHAIYNLRNDVPNTDVMDNILSIAYAVSLSAIYLNVQKIKSVVDKSDCDTKQKLQTLLHDVLVGNITNVQIAMKNSRLNYSDELSNLLNTGLKIVAQSYDYRKSHQYLYIWHNAGDNISEKVLNKINETEDSLKINNFLRFILVLNKELKKEVVNKIVEKSNLSLN